VTAVSFDIDSPDRSEDPNLNTGTRWSLWQDEDIRWGLDHNSSIEEIADSCAEGLRRFANE
jgi:hypothetical protein